jgi:hypothetical protein
MNHEAVKTAGNESIKRKRNQDPAAVNQRVVTSKKCLKKKTKFGRSMEGTQVQPGEAKGALAAGLKQLVLYCASWKHEKPSRKENWQRTRRMQRERKPGTRAESSQERKSLRK